MVTENKPLPPYEPLEDTPHRLLTQETYEKILKALAKKPEDLGRLLADLHPADIADLLERLPRSFREGIVSHIPYDHLGDVIAELDEGVQEHVLQLLEPEEIRHAINELDSDDAADLAQTVEDLSEDEDDGPEAEDLLTDPQQIRLLKYDPETAGGLMQLEVITMEAHTTVGEAFQEMRENPDDIPGGALTIFVVTPQRKLLGTVSTQRLVRAPLTASLESIMREEPVSVTPETPQHNVVQLFEKYDLRNLPVVNKRGYLLGRVTIDDILDVVMEESARTQARAAGVDESEDLFAPASETTRTRLPWLLVNLLTAIMAAAVIAMFESSIAKLTTLAVLMPIVASMGGNATTQTQTVIIRGLALGHITKQNAWELLKKEFGAGGFLGTILALLMALGTWLIYSNPKLAMVIALATLANHLIAAFAGWLTPLILKRFNYDPAISTGVITTTFTDVGGFFVFLGLATLILM